MEDSSGLPLISSTSSVDAKENAPTSTELAEHVLTVLGRRAQIAPADKRGKFPMAAMKTGADGSHFDMVPFTVAMTQETFENIKVLHKAARALAELVLADLGPSTADDSQSNGMNP